MSERKQEEAYERVILPHLTAAFNLARWIVRNDQDAEDVVQEACLRALRFFDTLRGSDALPWFLSIVRNTSYTWMRTNRASRHVRYDEDVHQPDSMGDDPESLAGREMNKEMLARALAALPDDQREAIVLYELESLSYKEIARITGVPMGTVMSRLARGRVRLQQMLMRHIHED